LKNRRHFWTKGIWVVVPFLHVQGMTLFPFVLIRNKSLLSDPKFVRHERIHLCQQIELWVLPFYVLYLWQYFTGRRQGLSHDQAYRQITFEREAYRYESQKGYLRSRPGRAWNLR